MTKIRNIFAIVLAFAVLIGVCPISANNATAGTSGVYIENGNIFEGEELSAANWYFGKSSGVELEKTDDTSVVAVKTRDAGKVLVSRTKVNVTEEIEETLKVTVKLSIAKLIENRKFGLVFGSPAMLADIDEDGTTWLWFEQTSFEEDNFSFVYGLKHFENQSERVLVSQTALTIDQANDITLEFIVSGDGKLSFDFCGQTIYTSLTANDVTAEGFIGFVQDGKKTLGSKLETEVYLTDINILNQFYDRPETPKTMTADFTGDVFNTQEWQLQSKSAAPNGGIYATDGVLKFEGSGQNGFFGSIHKYSNFVLEYDLFDVKNTPTVESDGWINMASYWQGVFFGIEGDITATLVRDDKRDCFIYFYASTDEVTGKRTSKNTIMRFTDRGVSKGSVILPDKYSMFSEGFEDKVRVRLAVIDGKMTVSLRLVSESEYTQIYSYEFENGYTPSGYISLHGEGNQFVEERTNYGASYFSLDNVSITNYDLNPTIIKVGFTSNVTINRKGDYVYQNTWSDKYLLLFTRGEGKK